MKLPVNQIICGDCLEVMRDFPDNSIDSIITDPPYGINYKGWDKFEDFVSFTESWIKECFRILKSTGTLWSFMSYSNIFEFVPLLEKYGYVHLENWVVWARQKGRGSSKHLKSQREDIFHVTKSDIFTWNNIKILREVIWAYKNRDGTPRGWFINEKGERKRWTGLGNVWVFSCPFWNSKNEDSYLHPSQKPLAMMERLILLSNNKGDIVLDSFSGSGTTCVAAKKLGRNYIGIDISPEYCELARKRLKGVKPNIFEKLKKKKISESFGLKVKSRKRKQ